jgi:serine/threonine-protein kinase
MPPPFARQGGSAGPEDSTGSPGAGVTGKAEANPSSLSATRSPDSSRETPSATLLSGSAAAAGEEDRLKTGTRLGDFELVRKLGQGGMGEVFLARQISLDREVALKVLPKPLAERGDFVERFQREARTMARLDHPCIVRAYAVDHDRGRHFVAMEYVDGRSMRDWLKQLGRIPVGDAVHVTLRCAEALRAAHSAQTIHRDVKPDNVLVARNGGVKVADFGLAKALDEDMTITESGVGFGTPF